MINIQRLFERPTRDYAISFLLFFKHLLMRFPIARASQKSLIFDTMREDKIQLDKKY